jgi:hypothetical protein
MGPKDLVRVSDREAKALREALERRAAMEPERAKRKQHRVDISEVGRIVVELRPHGAEPMCYVVVPVDLSEGGMAFLHGMFVYPGTACTARLRTLDGRMVGVLGRIVRCTLVSGRIHEVGMRFESPVDLGLFVKLDGGDGEGSGAEALGALWDRVEVLSEKIKRAAMVRDGVAGASLARQIEQICLRAASAGSD